VAIRTEMDLPQRLEDTKTGKNAVMEPICAETERVATEIVDAAFAIHKALGPGLTEPVYEACMCYELSKRGIPFKSQQTIPILYDGIRLDAKLRYDLLVADCVLVELKSVETLNRLFEAQLLTYLKITNLRLGLLINFNVPLIKNGIKRLVR
jgi:GxxExxY protein